MKKILENLALINLNQFGLNNNIDISDTHLAKNGVRGFKYSLVKNRTGKTIITVCFSKSAVPVFIY